jgi:type II secretion system protein G
MTIASPVTTTKFGPSGSLIKKNTARETTIDATAKINNETFFDLKYICLIIVENCGDILLIVAKYGRGFTLIELLVVVAIIGMLASIVLANISKARANARDAQRAAQVGEIQKVLEMYYLDHGSYPLSYHEVTLPAGCPTYDIVSTDPCAWPAFQNTLAPYIRSLPLDPINNASYYYHYFSGYYGPLGQWYYFTYQVENTNAPAEASDGAYSWGCAGYYMDNIGIIELGVTNCVVTP